MSEILNTAKYVFKIEQKCIKEVENQLDENFEKAINLLFQLSGKVIITGMGKSGIIAQKIAATMSSTGTTAIFLHPSEAAHGDLGVIQENDILITIGKSGESEELIHILPIVKKMGVKIISLVGNLDSSVAKLSDININIKVSEEASNLKLAPTSSTTASLVMGDALAMVLQELKNFDSKDFALFHPAGQLGKRLLLTLNDVMHKNENLPRIFLNDSQENLIYLMSKYGLGVVGVVNEDEELLGIITDGDLRRSLSKFKNNFFQTPLSDLMTKKPIGVKPSMKAYDALVFMEKERTINHLPVIKEKKYIGMVSLHDLIKLGL